jgi:hypothetical protein
MCVEEAGLVPQAIRAILFVFPYILTTLIMLQLTSHILERHLATAARFWPRMASMAGGPSDVIFPGIHLANVSLGLNYRDDFLCTEQDGYMSFTPNRQWHSGQYLVLCVLAIFYPPEEFQRRFDMACRVLRELSSEFSLSPDPVAFLILSIDADALLPLVRAHSAFTEIPCQSSSEVCSAFLNLDYGYHVFQARFPSATNGVGNSLTVLVTNVVQSYWNATWLRAWHVTGGVEGGVLFNGYYAAVFAYLVTLPYRLRRLDYFDFFSRLDIDAPFRRGTPTAKDDFFPVSEMVRRRAFLFGCFVSLDDRRISVNVMNMTTLFLETLARECGKPLRSHSIVTGFLHNERQNIPGIFQQFWLGYFSCPELKQFTNTWFTYPNGYQIHRWGDQQYYFRAHSLFAINASRTIITNRNAAGCYYYR